MTFILHCDVILRFTALFMMRKEPTVASLENIDLWIVQFRVLMHVEMSIAIAKMESPVCKYNDFGGEGFKQSRGSVSTVFTMEYHDCLALSWVIQEIGFQGIPGIDVDCSSNMTTLIFIWESAIHN
jgi:hypothetical protein